MYRINVEHGIVTESPESWIEELTEAIHKLALNRKCANLVHLLRKERESAERDVELIKLEKECAEEERDSEVEF